MKFKTILVTGSNGQLGSELKSLKSLFGGAKLFFTDIDDLDITDAASVKDFIVKNNIDLVINCAAYTAVDKAEEDFNRAELINAVAPTIIARILNEVGGKFIHISTDYVFDGKGFRPYTESDIPNPLGAYGNTKRSGEIAINESGCDYIIIRTSWLYSAFGSNFVKTIIRLAKERENLNVVADQVGTPTFAEDLAKAVIAIATGDKWINGVYHYSNEGVCSWFDFAKSIVEYSNLICEINPCSTKDYPTKAVRPFFSVLDKSKIKSTFNLVIPYWRDSLCICISKLIS
jgi:dTDP-4-dehydrorhamnose reductase